MKEVAAYRLENKYPGVIVINSEDPDLKYIYHTGEKQGVAIAGYKGIAGLTINQAKALLEELPGVLRMMGYSPKMLENGG